jgi:DNA-binding IclR family transcriptional regulator
VARSSSGESVLERAVRILDAFDPDSPSLTLGEVAARAALPLSTTSRLVAEMVEHGLLGRDLERRLSIGVGLWELAQRASPTLGLRDAALPFTEDLHAVVGQHIQLGVLQGDDVLFTERFNAPSAVVSVTGCSGETAACAPRPRVSCCSPTLRRRCSSP